MRSILILCGVLLWSGSAAAAEWVIDPLNSILGFAGKQGGSPFQGSFTRWTGTIDFDPANPSAGKAVIDIDMKSATTASRDKDDALPEADWFSVKTFPQARFEATSFRSKGGSVYEAVGSLTIRGIRKDVVLPFTLDVSGPKAKASGKLDIIRTDYGVGQGVWKSGETVALEVSVIVEVSATRKP
jgi:polyisoprenoid-binding protein YceI